MAGDQRLIANLEGPSPTPVWTGATRDTPEAAMKAHGSFSAMRRQGPADTLESVYGEIGCQLNPLFGCNEIVTITGNPLTRHKNKLTIRICTVMIPAILSVP